MERLKFTVKRDKWLNGEILGGLGRGMLLDDKGRMCCLGFYCEQLVGSTEVDIANVRLPSTDVVDFETATETQKEALQRLLFGEFEDVNDVVDLIANTNDDHNISNVARERRLKEYFNKISVDVEFVD